VGVSLVVVPASLHEQARALVGTDVDNPSSVDGASLADLLPAGLVPARGWPQPDDLVGIASSPAARLVVVDGSVVGGMGPAGLADAGVQEVGYGLIRAVRGTGVSDRALRLLVAELFADPAIVAVSAECLEANSPSWRLLERTGFTRVDVASREGHRRYELARP
jgi:RimJ/RimL family protein N-acetyltransferase